ncbi:MAG: protein-export chaperone SecB [Alphaproteobacteria bacterium]|nr:protein-export chaperone SecB [Alphaproteobacteria bacterium]
MADKENGADATAAGTTGEAEPRRSLIVNAQYIKDLSFENPRAPASLMQPQAPELQVNVDVGAGTVGNDRYEVVLTIHARATAKGETLFVVELAYGATVTLTNMRQEDVPQALLVETPRLLFPFARGIVADVTRDGGFPPVFMQPIDFNELLRRQTAAQAQAPAANA